MQIDQEIQVRMTVRTTRREEFEDRIIFLSVFNDIDWTKNGNDKVFFEFRSGKRVRKEISVGALVFFRSW